MDEEIDNPVPEAIVASGLTVGLEDFLRAPSTREGQGGFNREAFINNMREAEDGTGRLYIIDSRGPMYVIENGTLNAEPILDLRSAQPGFFFELNEHGFRDFAFHPDFENPGTAGFGKLYTSSTVTSDSGQVNIETEGVPDGFNATLHNVVTEWQLDPTNPSRVDPGSRRDVLRFAEPSGDHVVQQLVFDPTAQSGEQDYGLLYISVGDGGVGADGFELAQNTRNPNGKILRIDPLEQNGNAYSVPSANPFVGNPDFLPEIWAYGLRNPQNMSFDEATGRLFLSDIGQDRVEEVNLGVAGANYGWNEREGTFRFENSNVFPLPPDDAGFTYPVAQYDHDEGAAIAGGFVYRGDGIPELRGQYLFGDIANGRVFHVPADQLQLGGQADVRELTLVYEGQERTMQEILGGRVDLRFGADADGELYLLSKVDGMVRQLVALDAAEIVGTEAADVLTGTAADDMILAAGGDDDVEALAGADMLRGGTGNDRLFAGAGDDRAEGEQGNDRMRGQEGDDTLIGGPGVDTIYGDEGNDVIDGGPELDILYGNAGADLFVLGDPERYDLVRDFSIVEGDRVAIEIESLLTEGGALRDELVSARISGSDLLILANLPEPAGAGTTLANLGGLAAANPNLAAQDLLDSVLTASV